MSSASPTLAVPRTHAPYAPWPAFAADEMEAVNRVLASGRVNYWTGQEARAFEREYAAAAGCEYAVAVCNGTSALELAVQALGIPPGAEIVTSPRTFIASASCAVMRGCVPVLADVDRDSQNLTAGTIERVLSPRTRAIVVVHLAGWPCAMDPILALAEYHGLQVIEDCAQASGATYRGRPVGSLGHLAAFSFCQDKILSTGGEGGMLTTCARHLWERAWSFKDHGKNWAAAHQADPPPGFRWLHDAFGTNWRMTELQAAIGRVQLGKLPEWTRIRRANRLRLDEACRRFPCVRVPEPPAEIGHAAYKAYLFVEPQGLRAGWSRDRILAELTALGVPCFSGSCSELYLEKAFRASGLGPPAPLPVARELGETSLMFLVHPTLTATNLEETVEALGTVLARASR